MLPWLRLLSQHAFGNYQDLLRDVSRERVDGEVSRFWPTR